MVKKNDKNCDLNDIVVSGISGVFPQSENVDEFKENLLAGVCMISQHDRWNSKTKTGLLKTIDRFDHSFFQINRPQATSMPISSRLLLEKTFEAILDAGYNPSQLKGRNVAVVCAVWDACDEGDPSWDTDSENGGIILGGSHSAKPNRISYWLDITGPSFAVNSACSSSLYAMDLAVKLIRSGECEAAIVCASNLCFSNSKFLNNSPLLSQNGNTSAFNADVSGYTRAEATVVAFLQKRKHARRVYANIVHSKTNCDGFKAEGTTFPSVIHQKQLFKQFYEEIGLDPGLVSYVETHATATQVGDFVEGTSVEEIFCPGRKTPLKIGSVKSNMGHAEASSGLCSLVKMIVSFETGIIPPHIGYTNPNPKIKGLHNGRLEVTTKPTPIKGKYFGVNNFGVGGANGHMLLSPHDKLKQYDKFANYGIPLLVTASGRTEEAVDYLLEDVIKNSGDPEYVRLLHEIFSEEINGHFQRGYIIVDVGKEFKRSKKLISGEKRPIWFVFAGMGSQWPTMGVSLMTIPLFAESIRKSHEILRPKGIDLLKIITEDDPLMFKNILNSFVGIAAIQIALVDVLTALEIEPDGIIGHSVGELGCAYADGCLTAEQTILAAYYRGLVSLETDSINGGKMASIGNSYTTMKDQVPAEIDIACHNGPHNCTISGPAQAVDDYISELKQKNIFVREVDTANIAYHSRYIVPAAPQFNSYLQKIIPDPKLRSKKWICSSALAKDWHTSAVRYSSAEYHTNNLLNPVYFEESCKYIPDDAVLIEIAPHGLLNAILKRSLPQTVVNIPLTLRNHQNQVKYFLDAIGQMYEAGCVPKLSNLYPHVEFPVSKSTPMISPLIKWQHDEQWPVGRLDSQTVESGSRNVLINPQSEAFKFLHDHNINGISVYPGLGYLVMVWETLATICKKKLKQVPVVIENVSFERMTRIPEKGSIKFNVTIHVATNHFEVTESGAVVAKGTIRLAENIDKEVIGPVTTTDATSDNSVTMLSSEDFYKEMRLRRYCYKNTFKRVVNVNCKGTRGKVSWNDNFITFMDAMLQISLLNIDTRELLIPTFIRKIVIDVKQHFEILKTLDPTKPEFVVNFHPNINLLSSGGIQMTGWKTREIIRRPHRGNPVLETYQFLPYTNDDEEMDFDLAIRTCIHIAVENIATIKVKTIELLDSESVGDISVATRMSAITLDTLKDMPYIQASVNVLIDSEHSPNEIESLEKVGLEFIKNLSEDKTHSIIFTSKIGNHVKILTKIFDTIRDDGFLITKESIFETTSIESLGFTICFSRAISSTEKILLLRKVPEMTPNAISIEIKNDSYSWIAQLQSTLKTLTPENNEVLVLYSEKNPLSGILGLFNCIRKEEKGMSTRCFFIVDEKAEKFSLEKAFYKNQYDKNLSHNVYKNGQWGSYRYLPLKPAENIKTVDAVCEIEAPGDFSSIRWIESSLETDIKSEGGSVARVHYSGLNFKDIMLGSRNLSNLDSFYYSRLQQARLGFEFSGRDETGSRVMGIVRHGGIATYVETIPHFTWKVPRNMTLEEAASIPVAYITVIYAFFSKIHLKRGASVLIHAGSGGVGQAAINICLHYDCTIFTTVGSVGKKSFIRKMYPQIPATHICNSRDTSFETIIMQETNGRGVDVVLNCLSGDKMQASVRCVARRGHFLEIGKSNTVSPLELGCISNEITLHSILFDYVIWTPDEVALDLSEKFQKMLDQGVIKPINRVVFQIDQIEAAFKYMASAKHIGKVVIKLQEGERALEMEPNSWQVNAKPFVNCHKDKSYVIIGGLGGFGLELADWLVLRGARNLLLSSRSGIKTGYQAYRINLWRSYGVKVVISTEDVVAETGAKKMLQEASALGPIAGIFNLAVVLDDKPFPQQSEDSFRMSINPKAITTAHLDQLSRIMCPKLEYFVVFSSLLCGRGNPESSNYAFANSIMERICEKRRADNLPALAVQWGAIGDVGVVADFSGNDESLVIGGTSQQNVESCLKILNAFMKQENAIVSSIIVATKYDAETDIIDIVANVLGITDVSTVSQTWTLPELGMDSILAMELRQILESEFNFFFTPEDLRKLTFAKLYQLKQDKIETLKSGGSANEQTFHSPLENGKIKKAHSPVDGTTNVFIFPGVEGTTSVMDPLTKNLPMPTLCFQYDNTESASTLLTKLRDDFVKVILYKLEPDQEFRIIGYSLGGLIAIEAVCLLEEKGRRGHVWLIDSSPVYLLKKAIEFTSKQMNAKSESSQNNENVAMDRTNLLVEEVLNYNFSHALLESSCTLIKSAECQFDLDDSWSLTENFKNPIQVHQIDDTDHYTVLSDSRTAKIIMESPMWGK